jgi:hypothetical protein
MDKTLFAPPTKEELDLFAPPTKEELDLFAPPTKEELGMYNSEESDNFLETLDDYRRGTGQGLLLGHADEAGGGVQVLMNKLLGGVTDVDADLAARGFTGDLLPTSRDLYEKVVKENREADKLAQERSPIAYTMGNLTGGLVTSLATGAPLSPLSQATNLGKIGNAAFAGTLGGAATGLGMSEANILDGEYGKALTDTVEGAGIGALVGGGLQGGLIAGKGMLKGGKKVVDSIADTEFAKKIKDSFTTGLDAVNLITEKGKLAVYKNLKDISTKYGDKLAFLKKIKGDNVGAAEKAAASSKVKLDINEEIDLIKRAIDELEGLNNPNVEGDIAILKNHLDNLLQGKYNKGVPVEYTKITPAKTVTEKLPNQTSFDTDYKVNPISSLKDTPKNKKLLEQKLALLKAQNKLKTRQTGESVEYELVHDLENEYYHLVEKVKKQVESVIPGEEITKVLPVKGERIIRTTSEPFRDPSTAFNPKEMPFGEAENLKNFLNQITGVTENSPQRLIDLNATATAKQAAKGISDKAKQVESVKSALDESAKTYKILELLGIDKKQVVNGKLTAKGKRNLIRVIDTMTEKGKEGLEKREMFESAKKLVLELAPELADELIPQVEKASRQNYLAREVSKFSPLNPSTYFKAGLPGVANITGLAAKKVTNQVKDWTPDLVKDLARKAATGSPRMKKIALELSDVLKKDGVGRNAAMFSLLQDPQTRQMVDELLSTD